MNALEKKATFGIAVLFSLRMLGMFIILPVFALYAEHLNSNHTLAGLALGIYGFAQASLQIPFGFASDHWGRKPVLYAGLLLFCIGSIIAGSTLNIYMVILGRLFQGMGAISGVALALLADLTHETQRTKAMAIIGMSIGMTFAISMILSPLLAYWIGVQGIFMMIGFLALLGMAVVYFIIPNPQKAIAVTQAKMSHFSEVFKNSLLLKLDLSIFCLHALLMSIFMILPFRLKNLGIPPSQDWKIYLTIMLSAFILVIPAIFFSKRRTSTFLRGAIFILLLSQIILWYSGQNLSLLVISMIIFFVAFNFLEASLPTLISKVAPPHAKGTATGVYSSLQFLGVFTGAVVSGYLLQHYGKGILVISSILLSLLWLLLMSGLKETAFAPIPKKEDHVL